jgi:cell division protein FtsQ
MTRGRPPSGRSARARAQAGRSASAARASGRTPPSSRACSKSAKGAKSPKATKGRGDPHRTGSRTNVLRSPGTVSTTSAARFAARVRRRRRRRAGAVVLVVTMAGSVVWAVFGSGWLSVRRVVVSGNHRVSDGQVTAVLAQEVGGSMLLVDPAADGRRVSRLPLVSHATVRRRWPDTILVDLVERHEVAAVPAGKGAYTLFDRDAVRVATVDRVPAGLPIVRVDPSRAGAAGLRAAVETYRALPSWLRAQETALGADGPDGVWLTLSGGTRVIWGSAENSARKAEVLAGLRARSARGSGSSGGRVFDVSAPEAPAVR